MRTWQLAAYVLSLARTPVWAHDRGRDAFVLSRADAREQADKLGRGRYLIETLGCAYCHSPVKDDGAAVRILSGRRQRVALSLYGCRQFTTSPPTRSRVRELDATIRSGVS